MVARVQQGCRRAWTVFASVVTGPNSAIPLPGGGSHTGRAIAKAVAVSHTAVSRSSST